MKMTIKSVFIIIVLLSFVIKGSSQELADYDNKKSSLDKSSCDSLVDKYCLDYFIGERAFNWCLKSYNGDSVCFSDYLGKLVLLDFWFPGCGVCLMTSPENDKLMEEYGSEGLVVLGVEITNVSENKMSKFIKKTGVTYEMLYNGKEISEKYNIVGGPTYFLVNKNGTIIYAHFGLELKKLKNLIEKNL